MAQDINHYLAATSPENVSNGLSGPQETHYVNTGMSDVYGLLVLASIGASAYHGFKRNDSVGWGIVWGLLGGIAPVITPAIAVAQGFGEPERHGNPVNKFSMSEARAVLRDHDVILKYKGGAYMVSAVGKPGVYFTNDLDDAVEVGLKVARGADVPRRRSWQEWEDPSKITRADIVAAESDIYLNPKNGRSSSYSMKSVNLYMTMLSVAPNKLLTAKERRLAEGLR